MRLKKLKIHRRRAESMPIVSWNFVRPVGHGHNYG